MEFPTTATPQADIPTVASLLRQLGAKEDELQAKITLSADLQNEVIQLLEKRFGANAASKVNAIAQKISPVEDPVAFLEKCKALVEMVSSKEKAALLFEKLYDKVKK